MRHVKAFAGKAQALGGMVWAYIGPDPVPELPRFDVFVDRVSSTWVTRCCPATGSRSWRTRSIPTMSNGCTVATSISWARSRVSWCPSPSRKKHLKVGFDAMEWGILKRRVLKGHTEEDDE